MGVDHVKLGGSLRHRFEQDCLCCNRIGARSAEPKCARPDRMKLGACHRIAAGKQRDIMSKLRQLVDQPANDTLGAAIKFGGNAFGQRGDLSNPHGSLVGTIASGPTGSRRSKASTWAPLALFHWRPNIPD